MKKNKVKKLTIKDLEGLVSATGGYSIRKRWSPLPEPRSGDSRCYEEKVEGGAMTDLSGTTALKTNTTVVSETYEKRKK